MSNNKKLEELRAKKPNLYRLACELASFEKPYAVLASLEAILKTGMNERVKADGDTMVESMSSASERG